MVPTLCSDATGWIDGLKFPPDERTSDSLGRKTYISLYWKKSDLARKVFVGQKYGTKTAISVHTYPIPMYIHGGHKDFRVEDV